MIPDLLIKLLESITLNEVSLGYKTIYIFKPSEIEEAQIGYRVDLNSNSLIGSNDGDWLNSWYCIGYEDETDDPIIVDLDNDLNPVYTSMHGQGDWDISLISTSFVYFISSLDIINEISEDRKNPVQLEKNPISESERLKVMDEILHKNRGIDIDFWETWMDEY